jgi:hypothetical protein
VCVRFVGSEVRPRWSGCRAGSRFLPKGSLIGASDRGGDRRRAPRRWRSGEHPGGAHDPSYRWCQDSPVAPSSTWIRGSSPQSGPSSTAGMAAQWLPGSLAEPRPRIWLALKPSRGRVGPMTQQSGWHENPQDRSRLRCRDAVIWSSDVTPKVSPTVDRSDRTIPCGVAPAGPGAAERPVASIRRRP